MKSISRRDFLKTAAMGGAIISLSGRVMADESITSPVGRRPNIIFLMDDQHRWDHIGKINPGVITPALDKLAADGILFDQATCQGPMCVPSRYSIMLGLYPSQTRVLSNSDRLRDEQLPCDPLPEILRKAGYQTAGFGKTHWNLKESSTRGFEIRYIGQPAKHRGYETGAVMMGDRNPEGLKRYDKETEKFGDGEEGIKGYIGCTSKVPEEDHRDGWVFNECLKFLDLGLEGNKPLFLYLSFFKPHAGLNIPPGFEELYDIKNMPVPLQPRKQDVEPCHASWEGERPGFLNSSVRKEINIVKERADFWSKAGTEKWQRMILRYRANCSWIDSMFGRVLDKLREKGVLDNCLIVYVSDHGEMLGERCFRFTKYCLYESSVRVPMILGGTAVPKDRKGTIDSRPAELVDVLPTIMKAAGFDAKAGKPGENLLDPSQKTGAFSEYHDMDNRDSFMWRTPKYKLILCMKKKKMPDGKYSNDDIIGGELYDLQNDAREWKNLYKDEKYAGIREEYTRKILEHLERHGPVYSQDY